MLFNSFIFFIFLGIVLPIFYILPNKNSKNIFLLFSSYFFYGYWDWRFCSLLAITTIIDFIVCKHLFKTSDQRKRNWLLAISLFANLGILAFFKYFNFFVDSFQNICENFGCKVDYLHLNIILPVGISFYTFQELSYTIDIYRKKLEPTNNFVDFALFVSFFPQLVAGPIERAKALLPQLSKSLKPNKEQIKQGIVLIVMGLFRKVLIGDTAGRFVDHIFGNLEMFNSAEVLCALILFSIQIYADFSGYSHIARGTAKLFGVELMNNFEQPYLSRNITEFWKRWHISLSTWLRDYLYFSLGGNRKGNFRRYANILITMLLGGLWHGASWNFVIWGGLHGLYLVVHKLILGNQKINSEKIHKINFKIIFNIFVTYLFVLFTWLFFRSTSWDSTQLFIAKVFNWETSEYSLMLFGIVFAFSVMIIILDVLEYTTGSHTYILKIKSGGVIAGILTAMLLVCFLFMFQVDPLPFIYFQF
jgi:alginate O-acetyltransferase complex protein AlgI